MDRGHFRATTSVISLLEVLVLPLRKNEPLLAESYRQLLLESENLSVASLNAEIVEQAAKIRAVHNYSVPDAIQIATAINSGASVFVTSDAALASFQELQVVLVTDLLTTQ
jgi:predicted nucleic acid-binding protein